jgi:Rad3-related DNA helicase
MDKTSAALENSSTAINEPKVALLAKGLQKIFKTAIKKDNELNSLDYKVFINEEEEKKDFNRSKNGTFYVNSSSKNNRRVLNYWAFSPGIAMEELKKLGIRSIVLTSGTLSPLDAFKEDMKIKFPITLENPHVINSNQIWVGALAVGSTGKQLNSSYKIRETEDYKDELGMSILQICQTMIGRGGVGSTPSGPEVKGGVGIIIINQYSFLLHITIL